MKILKVVKGWTLRLLLKREMRKYRFGKCEWTRGYMHTLGILINLPYSILADYAEWKRWEPRQVKTEYDAGSRSAIERLYIMYDNLYRKEA